MALFRFLFSTLLVVFTLGIYEQSTRSIACLNLRAPDRHLLSHLNFRYHQPVKLLQLRGGLFSSDESIECENVLSLVERANKCERCHDRSLKTCTTMNSATNLAALRMRTKKTKSYGMNARKS
mmetsp:Transcript_14534/g.49636  ORF Transcript_14534/g.49636 Transcript_14534/m.49636 type:complete len:123 (+) Transcript_14534:538-906(+)